MGFGDSVGSANFHMLYFVFTDQVVGSLRADSESLAYFLDCKDIRILFQNSFLPVSESKDGGNPDEQNAACLMPGSGVKNSARPCPKIPTPVICCLLVL